MFISINGSKTMIIDLKANEEFAIKAEGIKKNNQGNHELYDCPAGYKTIGHGYNIEAHGLPDDIAKMLLKRQLRDCEAELAKKVKGWDDLDFVRRQVLIDMIFNMGWSTLRKFKKMFAAIEKKDYEEAANQMIDSGWYKQVKHRAEVLVESMRSGEWKEY